MEIISEDANGWHQDGWLVFHGTSMENAIKIARQEPYKPLLEQAEDFLAAFGLTLRDMLDDEDFADMRRFIFASERDSIMSVADTFQKARNYALRIPEWQWHLFQHIFSQLEIETADRSWASLASEYSSGQPNPAVLIFKSPTPIPMPDPQFAMFWRGKEFKVPNPLPTGYELLKIVEITRNITNS